MKRLKGILSDKLTKVAWYLKGVNLPNRREMTYINFCIHTEVIYDDKIYNALLKFSKDFFELTGKKITACVSTPISPKIGKPVSKTGFSRDMFRSRVNGLCEYSEVGYHGHFLFEQGDIHLYRDNYDKALVKRQIKEEMDWFKNIGIVPKLYVSGCWVLTEDMIEELESFGIEVDMSVRKGKADTFGYTYLDLDNIPDAGRPFILPPSKGIVEIQSIFGPVMPPPLMKGHLSRHINSGGDGELFFVFPLHDWDLPKYNRTIWSNIRELNRYKSRIDWMNISDMRNSFISVKAGA